MINYLDSELDKNQNMKNILVGYLYLCSLDKNFIGAFLFSYYDNGYNFDLIKFYKNYNGDSITDSISLGENNIQFVNFDESLINEFVPEIELNTIVYDPYEILEKLTKKKKENFVASNALIIDSKYIDDIRDKINNKQNERLNIDLKVFYTLVDYYKILISEEDRNIYTLTNLFQGRLQNSSLDKQQLHCDALMEAIKRSKEDSRFFDEKEISLYTKILNMQNK